MTLKTKIIAASLLLCHATSLFGAVGDAEAIAVGGTSAAATALARADIALARSVLNPTALRGSLGENVASKAFMKNVLAKTGNWQSVTPRSGPQGLDHLFIKTDQNGIPRQLLVGESKYNTSPLGTTKDGTQMGERWTNKRLSALGTRYLSVAQETGIKIAAVPLSPNRQITVVLKNGQTVHFWKESSQAAWKFSGSESQLAEAQKLAKNYGVLFQDAGHGQITYRSRIFNIIPRGNDLEIAIYDAKNLNGRHLKGLIPTGTIKLPNALSGKGLIPRDDLARTFQSKLGYSDAQAREVADKLVKEYNAKQLMRPVSLPKSVLGSSGIAAVAVAGLDAIFQYVTTGQVDAGRLALSGGSALLGVAAGQGIQIGLDRLLDNRRVGSLAAPLNCSARGLTTSLSAFGGGVIATALFSYGSYFLGYSDLRTANRGMIAGTAGAAAGGLATWGAMSAVAAWGTASTGTAIAGLSGAAAQGATLAWFGGGAVAAGGGGIAGGGMVLAAGGGVVALIAAYGIYKWYQLSDAKDENKRIRELLAAYSQDSTMNKIINNSPFVRALGHR